MPVSIVDYSTDTVNGSLNLTVDLTSTPDPGDVLAVLIAAGPYADTSITDVNVDDDDAVVYQPTNADVVIGGVTIGARLIRCGGTETRVVVSIANAAGDLVAGVWRLADEARIPPYAYGADSDVGATTPDVPAFTPTAAGIAVTMLAVANSTGVSDVATGWTSDSSSSNLMAWRFAHDSVTAGAISAAPYPDAVDDEWASIVVALADLGTLLGPSSSPSTEWAGRVTDAAPAEIPPPLPPADPSYPPMPPDSAGYRVPLPPWEPGPQYRPGSP